MKNKGASIYLTDNQITILYNSLPDIDERNIDDTSVKLLAQTYKLESKEFISIISQIKKKFLKGR